MPDVNPAPLTLAYAPRPPRLTRRRLALAALVALFIAGFTWGLAKHKALRQWGESRVAVWRFEQAKYRARAAGKRLMATPEDPEAIAAARAAWVDLIRQAATLGGSNATAYMGLAAPTQPLLIGDLSLPRESHLVCVGFDGKQLWTQTWPEPRAGGPGRVMTTAVRVHIAEGEGALQFGVARVDPDDPAAFTIPFFSNHVTGALRGRLAQATAGRNRLVFSGPGWLTDGGHWCDWWPGSAAMALEEARLAPTSRLSGRGARAVAFLPDGSIAAAAPGRVFLAPPDGPVDLIPLPFSGRPNFHDVFCFSPDGTRLFFGGTSRPWVVVGLPAGEVLVRSDARGSAGRPSPAFVEGDRLLVGDNVGVTEWNLGNGAPGTPNKGAVWMLSAGGDVIVSAISKGCVVYDVQTRAPRLTIPISAQPTSLSVSPDGATIAAKAQDGAIVYDARTGAVRWSHRGDNDWQTSWARVRWSTDGRLAAAAGSHHAYVWTTATPGTMYRLPYGRGSGIRDVALSADGSRLASVSEDDDAIQLWDLSALPGLR